jgi:pimeloyl-ACP methyl ester carboxylesterase
LNAHEMSHRRRALQEAERRLFDRFGVAVGSRDVWLADPPLRVRVLDSGTGPPLILIHGSGMTAATWAPLMPHPSGRRLLALDLPGFGLSDPYDYGGRPLRSHAVAQLHSLLDALELEQADIVGTSLGGMWALNLAAACPAGRKPCAATCASRCPLPRRPRAVRRADRGVRGCAAGCPIELTGRSSRTRERRSCATR